MSRPVAHSTCELPVGARTFVCHDLHEASGARHPKQRLPLKRDEFGTGSAALASPSGASRLSQRVSGRSPPAPPLSMAVCLEGLCVSKGAHAVLIDSTHSTVDTDTREMSGVLPSSPIQSRLSSLQDKHHEPRADLPLFQRCDFIRLVNRASCTSGRDGPAFTLESKLGKGAFGDVHLMIGRAGSSSCERVLKVVNKRRAERKGVSANLLQREIDVLRVVDHPHVVRLFEYHNEADNICLVMDICRGGDLRGLTTQFAKDETLMPESLARRCFSQILEALAYCHSQGVVHRDIKLENVMLRNAVTAESSPHAVHAVIVDFGLAEFFGQRHGRSLRLREIAGSPSTMAPEMLRREGSYKSDIFSVGCLLYAVLNPRGEWIDSRAVPTLYSYPFLSSPSSTDPDGYISLLDLQRHGPPMQKLRSASASARHAVRQLLCFDESKRPDATECLHLPWLVIAEAERQSAAPPVDGHIHILTQDRRLRAWQRAVIMQAVTQLPALKLADLEVSFRAMDRGRMGSITSDDLRQCLEDAGTPAQESQDMAASVMTRHDGDRSGTLEWTEFVAAMIPSSEELLSAALEMAFLNLDHNFDGTLKRENIRALIESEEHLELRLLSSEELQDLFSGSGGQLTLSAFKKHFTDRL